MEKGADSFRLRPEYLLCMTALLWSTGGVLVKWITWEPMAIAGMRSAFAACVLQVAYRRGCLDFSVAQIAAAVFYAINVILFVLSNKLTTAANAIVLQYMAPVYVAIFSGYVLGERVRRLEWVFILAAFGGVCLFFLDGLSVEGFRGNILAIIGGVAFAFYIIFMRKQKRGNPLGSVLLGNIITVLVAMPFMRGLSFSDVNWTGLILLGVFQLGLSHVLYARAIKKVTAIKSAMIPMAEPVLNPLWVFLFLGEMPGKWAFCGGVVVIAAVMGFSWVSASAERVD